MSLSSGRNEISDIFADISMTSDSPQSREWALLLADMYARWAERHDFRSATLSGSDGDRADLCAISLGIEGASVFAMLKNETGPHTRFLASTAVGNGVTDIATVLVYPLLPGDAVETRPWMEKFFSINETWQAEDRRKLLAYARDLLNSDYAGHRLTFQLFAQSPPFAHLAAVYRNFDWDGPLEFVQNSAGLSAHVLDDTDRKPGDGAVSQWYRNRAAVKNDGE